MVSDALGDQLRRIGLLPALAVLFATALATFALLDRVVPASISGGAPQTIRPAQAVSQPPAPVASSVVGFSGPLAASSARTDRAFKAAQRQELRQARQEYAAMRHGLKPPIVSPLRAAPTSKPNKPTTSSPSAPTTKPTQPNQGYRHPGSGGSAVSGASSHP